MKHIRRTDHSAEEHSDDASAGEGTHVLNNDTQISRPEPTLNKSDEMKLKVLIADDSTEVRNRLKEMLKENKSIYLTGEAVDAEQAVTVLRHLKPDVVILDIHMPGGGGIGVLKDIKTTDPGPITIVFTAFSYPQYRQACLAAGADYFFDKTDDVQKMTDVLAELTQKHITNRNNEK